MVRSLKERLGGCFLPEGRRKRYWAQVFLLVGLGVLGSENVGDRFLPLRFWFYQTLHRVDWRRPEPSYTRLLLIRDDAFWSQGLAARTPVNRRYLADLIGLAARGGPLVIALDVQLNSLRSGFNQPRDRDDKCLLKAIQDAATHSRVVLATDIDSYDEQSGKPIETSTIYRDAIPKSGRVTRGYIELLDDVRAAALTLVFATGERIDSFSEAIVRAFAKEQGDEKRIKADWVQSDHGPLANFSSREDFERRVIPADSILPPDKWIARPKPEEGVDECPTGISVSSPATPGLAGTIVLIGGDWNSLGPAKGERVDVSPTPAGDLPGVYIHAAYVESFLNTGGLLYRLPKLYESIVEIMVSLALATALVWKRKWFTGSLWAAVVITVLLLAFSYLLMMLFGFYFDLVIPALLVLTHWFYHQFKEWREKARLWERLPEEEKLKFSS